MPPEAAKTAEDRQQWMDVWSRTAPKYRRRAILMVCLLALLFAGLCCFTFWLRTGVPWPWRYDGYWDLMARSFRPTGADQVTLNDFLSAPISVKDVPVHGIIMGLLFASLSSIPLLVAILYRLPTSTLLAAMVVFLASMPWLGLTVLLGSALTALKPFKFSFRYASALVGLVPIAVYFVSASREPAGSVGGLVQHRALLYAPWVLALLGSCVICAVALGIARLINYRPGGVPPLLAMLFAVPVYLFHSQVGEDELEYRLLEQELGPSSTRRFRTLDVGAEAAREATRRWSESREDSYDEIYRQMLERMLRRAMLQSETDRTEAVAMCNAFMKRFPKSRYVENVVCLKARAQDQRIQRARLFEDHRAEYRCDIPRQASRRTWETLLQEFPHSVPGAAALHRMAILEARDGRLDEAVALLDKLLRQFDDAHVASQPADAGVRSRASVFRRTPPSSSLGVDLSMLLRQAKRLREMLVACRDDAAKAYEEVFAEATEDPQARLHPMQLLLWLDESDPHYRKNLAGIAQAFPDSETAAYIAVRLALLEPAVSRRIQKFEMAAETLTGRPSGAEALFHLGDARQDDSIIDEARTAFDQLVRNYPDSCWAADAKQRLASLSLLDASTGLPSG